MKRRALALIAVTALSLALGGFSCEGSPQTPAVEYLPIDALQ